MRTSGHILPLSRTLHGSHLLWAKSSPQPRGRRTICPFPPFPAPAPLSLCPSLPLPHSAPAMRVCFLFLQCLKPASSVSSLRTVCSLCLERPSTSFKSLLKCHCFQSPSLAAPTPVKTTSVSALPTPSLPYQLLMPLCTDCVYYHSSLQNARQGFLPVFVHCYVASTYNSILHTTGTWYWFVKILHKHAMR